MNNIHTTSAGAAALTLALVTPGFADCASEIHTLKSTQFTGSVKPSDTTPNTGMVGRGETSMQNQTAMQSGGEPPKVESEKMTAPQGGTTGSGTGVNVAAQKAGQTPETQATPAMNAAVGQTAASPQDVQQQMAGKPTAAQQAQANAATASRSGSEPAAMPAGGGAQAEFNVLIQQAENYHKLGNEEACMNVVKQVKSATQ